MKKRNDGIIILTASQAALAGIYGLSIYSATKYALRGLAETIYMELKPYNISVTLSLPPDTDTPGFEKENVGKPAETILISESAGLFQPDVVAKKILEDALVSIETKLYVKILTEPISSVITRNTYLSFIFRLAISTVTLASKASF